jgi:hypothetical protein
MDSFTKSPDEYWALLTNNGAEARSTTPEQGSSGAGCSKALQWCRNPRKRRHCRLYIENTKREICQSNRNHQTNKPRCRVVLAPLVRWNDFMMGVFLALAFWGLGYGIQRMFNLFHMDIRDRFFFYYRGTQLEHIINSLRIYFSWFFYFLFFIFFWLAPTGTCGTLASRRYWPGHNYDT